MAKAKRFIQNDNNNAVVYARYSSDAQSEASIDQQLEAAREYANAHGLHIIQEYADYAISGTRDDRPELMKMLYDVKHTKPGYLILWKTDRLSRDQYDAPIFKSQLRDAGVKIEYVAESLPEDEGSRILMEGIYETMAAYYIHQMKQNISRSLESKARMGLYTGHKILGYVGKKDHPYEIDPTTAPIVQRIFNDYASGKKLSEIATELNAAGHKTVRNNPFTEKSLWNTLNVKSYTGEYHYGDIVIPDGMPVIITTELFEKCQKLMQTNKKRGRKIKTKDDIIPNYWLTGHLFCGECEASMCGISGTSHTGDIHYYYACMNHRSHKCNAKNIPKQQLENIVQAILQDCINAASIRMLIAEKVYDYYKREHCSDESYLASIQARLKDVEKKLDNITNAITEGIFNEYTQNKMKELMSTKSMYEDELKAEQNRQKYSLKLEHVLKYLECYTGDMSNPVIRARVLDFLVNKIFVYKDKIVINFYYSEDNREIKIKDLQERLDIVKQANDIMTEEFEIPAEYENRFEEYFKYVTGDGVDVLDETGDSNFFW